MKQIELDAGYTISPFIGFLAGGGFLTYILYYICTHHDPMWFIAVYVGSIASIVFGVIVGVLSYIMLRIVLHFYGKDRTLSLGKIKISCEIAEDTGW